MPQLKNINHLLNQSFGYLTIVKDLGLVEFNGYHKRMVIAKCKCGNIKQFILSAIINEMSTSCGCRQVEVLKERNFKHGLRRHPLNSVWKGIKGRCYNEKSTQYKDYGGCGITMCDEWKNDFQAFYVWAIANGWEKGLDIDRRENDGIYEPNNCRFVTRKINNSNKRTNKLLEFNGLTKSLCEWAEQYGLQRKLLHQRIFIYKWSIERALTEAVKN